MSTKQTIISEYQKHMLKIISIHRDNNKKNAEKLWECIPELPDGFTINVSTFSDVWLTYPYDRKLIKEVISCFENSGWSIRSERKESDLESAYDTPRITFRSSGQYSWEHVYIIVEFSDFKEGSSCKRKVIGKKTKEFDVVEFVCNEQE